MFDETVLYKEYKSIRKTILDGYLLPYYIEMVNVPSEYDYTITGWRRIISQLTEENKQLLIEASKKRRKNTSQILKGTHKEYNTLDEYYKDELNDFIKEYPVYKKILGGE